MRKITLFMVMVIVCSIQVWAQNRTVTGRVTDSENIPLPAITVTAVGTNVATTTNDDGVFSLVVPPGVTQLEFTSVGFASVVRAIGTSTNFDVQLAPVGASLDEVVVVGYGVQQRRSFTGSASNIQTKEFAQLVTPSVDRQLAGRAAGVQVSTSGGLVNSPARIRIRGMNSISGNLSPLIVVDGVPFINGNLASTTNSNALGDLNPNDIESMEILKDGSATAIFGSRAAGGVIMITTKKGNRQGLRISYDATVGVTNVRNKFNLLNANQFVEIANEKMNNGGVAPAAVANPGVDTDWQDEVFINNAIANQHNISFSGGNQKTTYYFSAGYSNQQGVILSNKNTAYRLRFNFESDLTNWLKFGNNTTLAKQIDYDQNNGANALGGAVASTLRQLPNVSPYNADHPSGFNILSPLANSMEPAPNLQSVDDNFNNVAFTLRTNEQSSDKHRLVNNSFIEISPVRGLRFRSSFTYDLLADYSFQRWDPRHGDGFGYQGYGYNSQQNYNRYVFQNYANYNITAGEHSFYLTAGHELQQDNTKWFSSSGSQVADRFFLEENLISGSMQVQSIGGSYSKSALESFFGRVNYDFANRYFLQASFRRDGMSSLAPENRYGVFPGVSVGWRISEEGFWRNSPGLSRALNDLKFKASYAIVGNQLGGFPYLSTFANRPYGNLSGLGPSEVGNRELLWERSKKWDVGLEASIMNNRFTFTADYFLNDIDEIVLGVPTPPSAGVPNNRIFQNIGTARNAGYELALMGDIVRTSNFVWGFNVNFTRVDNEVTYLYSIAGEPVDYIPNGNYNLIQVGQPMNVLHGYRWAGVNPANGNPMYYSSDNEIVQHNSASATANNAYYTAKSINDTEMTADNRTTLGFDDRTILGKAIPTWFGGFGNNFRFGNFDAEFFFRFSGGNHIMNITRQEILLNQQFQNNGVEILDRWTTPGQVTNVPRLYYGNGNAINQNTLATSRFVEKGDFLRLQNVVLGYNFNPERLRNATNNILSGLRVFVQGQNLWMSTAYTGADPENATETGQDWAISPQVGIVSGGVKVTF